jgi:hypothetical protein
MQQRQRIRQHHRANRERQRNGHVDRARWRALPATEQQLQALRRIATETGITFVVGITRGEAWRRIKPATRLVAPPHRAKCAPPWWTRDKLARAVLDGLVAGGLLVDDRHVTVLAAEKRWAPPQGGAGVVVEITRPGAAEADRRRSHGTSGDERRAA